MPYDPADVAEISRILSDFLSTITGGFGSVESSDAPRRLMRVLIIINICVASMNWILSNQAYVAQLFKKVLLISLIVWLVENWGSFVLIIFESFSLLGIQLSGGGISEEAIRNPGAVAIKGFEVAIAYTEALDSLAGWTAFFNNAPLIFVTGIALISVLIAFGVITLQLFFALVMFYLGSVLAFLTLPFATLDQTKWLSERPVGWVFASALKFASIIVVLALTSGLLDELKPSNTGELTVARALTTTLICAMLTVMSILAPKLAADLLSGAPTLGFSDVVGAGSAAGRGVGGAATAATGAAVAATGVGAVAATARAADVATATARAGGQMTARGAKAVEASEAGGARAVSFGRAEAGRSMLRGAASLGRSFKEASSSAGSRGSAPAPSF